MDKVISATTQRRRQLKRWLLGVGLLAALLAARPLLPPELDAGDNGPTK